MESKMLEDRNMERGKIEKEKTPAFTHEHTKQVGREMKRQRLI
jgi:hypothetical protein